MGSVLSWGANALLFALGCFLAADTGNAVLAAVLLAPPDEIGESPAPSPIGKRSWEERQVILTRNLFKSSTSAAELPPVPVEDLEPTRLPLTLLGTAAAENPELAWAAIDDREKRDTVIVGVGDRVASAQVQRIERRRVILLENGVPRELVLETDTPRARSQPSARVRPVPSPDRRASARRPARERAPVAGRGIEGAMRSPANILSQARILPKWEDGQMQGVQLDAIKAGSTLEAAGFLDGDLITEINGVTVDSPEQSALLVKELTEAAVIRATVEREGQRVTVEFEKEE